MTSFARSLSLISLALNVVLGGVLYGMRWLHELERSDGQRLQSQCAIERRVLEGLSVSKVNRANVLAVLAGAGLSHAEHAEGGGASLSVGSLHFFFDGNDVLAQIQTRDSER